MKQTQLKKEGGHFEAREHKTSGSLCPPEPPLGEFGSAL